MKFINLFFAVALILTTSACSDWIYRIDVPQGNFLDQKDVDRLRIGMTKEQVVYVLGNPVVQDSFNHDKWYYVYQMKRGMSKRGEDFRKELIIHFVGDKLDKVEGDFELKEAFYTPLDQ